MPCGRNSLSSVLISQRVGDFHHGFTKQAVVAACVGHWQLFELQGALNALGQLAAFRRANTLRTCSVLSTPDSMTNSTASSTASRP